MTDNEFRLNMPEISQFEEKLRAAEANLGVGASGGEGGTHLCPPLRSTFAVWDDSAFRGGLIKCIILYGYRGAGGVWNSYFL